MPGGQLVAVLEALPCAVLVFGRDNRLVGGNRRAADLLGCAVSDLVGEALDREEPTPTVGPGVIGALRLATHESDQASLETVLIRADGAVLPLQLSATLLPETGELVCTVDDISPRRAIEARLTAALDSAEASARTKAEFLANMSHELRTPLNGVLGMTRLMLQTELDDEQLDMAEAVRDSASDLLDLVNDVLEYSSIEAGRVNLENVDFDPRRLLHEQIDIHRESARARGLEFKTSVQSDVPVRVHGDVGRVRQLLHHLVSNAVKFTKAGEVALSLRWITGGPAPRLRFEVRDTGVGVSPTAARAIFSPFVQADVATYRRFGGTGLGLVICRQLVELMGGSIEYDSVPGEGSRFWFDLPLPPVDGAQDEDLPDLREFRFLILAAQASTADALREMLGQAGGNVSIAPTLDEGLPQIADADENDRPFDLVLVDGSLADGGPKAIARRIRGLILVTRPALVLLVDGAAPGRVHGFVGTLLQPPTAPRLFQTVTAALTGTSVTTTMIGYPEGVERRGDVRILVVDDNGINQKVLLGQLSRRGVPADAVASGLEALDALERIPYSMVLLDIYMPELDGYETTRRLRRDPRFRDLPIVAVTASATREERDRCFALGMNDFISKPVTDGELDRALARWIDGARAKPAPPRAAPPTAPNNSDGGIDRAVIDRLQELASATRQPELVGQLIDSFVGEAPARLARLRRAIEAHDAVDCHAAAHALKGVSLNIGAVEVAGLARELEDREAEASRKLRTLARLESAFEATRVALLALRS